MSGKYRTEGSENDMKCTTRIINSNRVYKLSLPCLAVYSSLLVKTYT